MKNTIEIQFETRNSLNLKIGDYVKHERGCFGKVVVVEYNDADEATIEWLDDCAGMMSQRVSQCYLKKIAHFMTGFPKTLFTPKFKIGFPQIGAGLAGGDWSRISKMIEKFSEDVASHADVTVVEYQP